MKRLTVAWAVLRGRPVIYRATVVGKTLVVGHHSIVTECSFTGAIGPAIMVVSDRV